MKKYIVLIAAITLLACNSLPKGEQFLYSEGEIVYHKNENIPMLIDKPIYKGGKKLYKVVFKNEEGYLMYNTLEESEILSSPE